MQVATYGAGVANRREKEKKEGFAENYVMMLYSSEFLIYSKYGDEGVDHCIDHSPSLHYSIFLVPCSIFIYLCETLLLLLFSAVGYARSEARTTPVYWQVIFV